MKKIVSALLVCILLVGTLFTLVSCGGGLSGTYKGNNIITQFDLKFSGKNVTVIVGDKELKGTYEIKENDDKETITFDFVDEKDATDDEKKILGVIDKLLKADLPMEEDDGILTIAYVLSFKKK